MQLSVLHLTTWKIAQLIDVAFIYFTLEPDKTQFGSDMSYYSGRTFRFCSYINKDLILADDMFFYQI